MDRTDNFEKYKITKASTNKVVTNVYMDSFGIEKVRFQNVNYKDKNSIDCYLEFEEVALLATDAASGRLFKELETSGKKVITMGGSKHSKIPSYNGAPESRILSLGRMAKDNGDVTIFINMTRGKGKIGETGLIIPDGDPDLKISVPVSIEKFRSMMIFIHDSVNAYLAHMVNGLVKQCKAEREAYEASKNQQN